SSRPQVKQTRPPDHGEQNRTATHPPDTILTDIRSVSAAHRNRSPIYDAVLLRGCAVMASAGSALIPAMRHREAHRRAEAEVAEPHPWMACNAARFSRPAARPSIGVTDDTTHLSKHCKGRKSANPHRKVDRYMPSVFP